MFVEFEKRIAHLSETVRELEAAGKHSTEECLRLIGALEEAEKLFAFFKNQRQQREAHHVGIS